MIPSASPSRPRIRVSTEIDTLVIGAGQAGLAASYHLTRVGRRHLVLERSRVAHSWRARRWDSFTLVGPNWTCALPGAPYRGGDPDGYMGKDEVVHFFASYARGMGAPIREGAAARRLRRDEAADRYLIDLGDEIVGARNVVVATGAYERARVPRGAAGLSGVTQLHSDTYRNAAELPDGAILVVGSGQSGCQIAEDLREAGRVVYLSTGGAGWFPRRYRGRDNLWWREQMGYFDHSVDTLTSPADRMNAVPVQTGRGGGHDINLRTLAAMGVTLAGRFVGAEGRHVRTADDLDANIARSDGVARKLVADIDEFIRVRGISAPPGELQIPDPHGEGLAGDIDLGRSGISTVIWATGYAVDFGWIELPVFDEYGYPRQRRGATPSPGLYFVGLPWMHTRRSGLIFGVGHDAEHIADHIATTRP